MNSGTLGLPGNQEYIPNSGISWGDLDNGLVSYWNLQELNGSRADIKGLSTVYPKVATSAGSVTQGIGINGFCATMNQNCLLCESNISQYFPLYFTICTWFKITAFKSGVTDGLFTKGNPTAGNRIWGIQRNTGTGKLRFEISSNASPAVALSLDLNSAGTIALNTWYFVVCWYDGTAVYGQVNNGSIDSAAYTAGSYHAATEASMLCIGGYNDSNTFDLKGSMDRTGMWSRVLTTAEKTFLYNGGLGQLHP